LTDFQIPITALYVGLNGLIALALAYLVTRRRQATKVGFGDGGKPEMLQAIRVQGNFVEYVPIALLFVFVLELMQAPLWLLHGLGAALTIGRVAHAQGLSSSTGQTVGRGVGTALTWLVYLVGAVACLYYALG